MEREDICRSKVLNFFENDSSLEEKIQKYVDNIIKEFYMPSLSIYAANNDSFEELKLKFGNSSIPQDISYKEEDIYNYLSKLKIDVINKSTRVSSTNMVGHMTSGLPFFHRPLSKLITSMNQNLVKIETSSSMSFLEKETISKLHRIFYNQPNEFYDKYLCATDGSFGCITSGGTIANITAMWAARNWAFPRTKNFKGIEEEGPIEALRYYNYNNMAIIGSELMHYSFKKAADILGIGLKNLYTIPVDSEYKIRIDLLIEKLEELKKKKIKVIAIIGIACTTEVGSIDNLEKLSSLAKEYNTIFHVDGAWGGSFIMSNKYRHLLKGIEKADTITIDGHKLLYTPMGCGVVLFKSPMLPVTTIKKVASYIIRENSMDQGKITLEGSRPANVLYLNASLSLLGQKGFNDIFQLVVKSTKYMASLIERSSEFELISEPVTNIFLYRYIPSWLRCKYVNGYKNKLLNENISKSNETLLGKQNEFENISTTPTSMTYSIENEKECSDVIYTDEETIKCEEAVSMDEETIIYERSISIDEETLQCDGYNYTNEENEIIDYFTTSLQEKQKREGKCFVSKTIIRTTKYENRIAVFRVVIANPLVSYEIIKDVINEQIKFGKDLEDEYKKRSKK